MKTLSERVAVITGGAEGLGRAIAEVMAQKRALVVIADVNEAALDRAERELAALGTEVLAVKTDVSRYEDVAALAERVRARFGRVDVLCNNAGVSTYGLTWELSLKDWSWVLGVNLWGTIHAIKAFVPGMLEQGGDGHIVNVASMAGLVSVPSGAAYGASKHAVVTLSETLHQELSMLGSRLRVSVACPSFVNTKIVDAGRNRPEALRNAVGEGGRLPPAREEAMRRLTGAGAAPETVARAIVDAVLNERFYVFTGPEAKDGARARLNSIVNEGNPPTGAM